MKLLDSLLHRKPDVARLKARRDVPGLVKALENLGLTAHGQAVTAIKELKPREAVEPLLALLARDERPWYWVSILELLGCIGDARAYEPLLAALGNRELAREAAKALGRLGDRRAIEPLLQALSAPDAKVDLQDGAAEALAAFGELRAIEPLVRALGMQNKPKAIHDALTRLADKAPDQVIAALSRALESDRATCRWEAARALVNLGDKAADILLTAVGNQDNSVRHIAVEALRERKNPRLRDRIEAVLAQGLLDEYLVAKYQDLGGDLFGVLTSAAQQSHYGQLIAARMLGKYGSRATPSLAGLLKVEDRDVRNAAIESLIRLGDIEELVSALPDKQTSFAIKEALLRAKHPAAPALVFPLLTDRGSPVRREAAVILLENTAAGRLGGLDESLLADAMIKTLQDPDDFLREVAAETLGWLREPRAVPHLEAFLTIPNLTMHARATVQKALERIGKTAAAPAGGADITP